MGTKTDIYIGHTEKSLKNRFENEIENSIINFNESAKFPSRLIEQAILIAIENELSRIGVKICGKQHKFYDLDLFINKYLSLPMNSKLNLRKNLAEKLLNKYFKIQILEKHYTKNYVCEREKWYKENYPDSSGTVYPYGLNMNSYVESNKNYVALPMYDIAFMISLGYRVPKISRLIKKLYKIDVSEDIVYNRITQFYKSVENAEDRFLKPVIQKLIQNFPNLSGNKYAEIIHRKEGRQFFDSRGCPFKRWFGDIKLREIKKAISLNKFNWINVKELVGEIRKGNFIKGYHRSYWIDLFIKGISNNELALHAGYKSSDSFRKHFFQLQECKKAFGVINSKQAIQKYRKLETIKILKDSLSPSFSTFEDIYTDTFGFQNREKYNEKYRKHYDTGSYLFERSLRNYFRYLFDGMSLNKILNLYGCKNTP